MVAPQNFEILKSGKIFAIFKKKDIILTSQEVWVKNTSLITSHQFILGLLVKWSVFSLSRIKQTFTRPSRSNSRKCYSVGQCKDTGKPQ